jgi:internalin A
MKTSLLVLLIPLLALGFLPLVSADGPIFPDKNLEAAVRKQVFGNPEQLTAEEISKLSTLNLKGKGIRDLTGMEKCTHLAALDAADNQIADLGPLKGLSELQTVTLSNNKIQDLTPLGELTRLQYIELTGNEVSNLAPLKNLTALNALYLSKNKIKDITPLAGLTRLFSLYLQGNQVADLKPISNLKSLSSLDLSGNQVSNISPLANLTGLRYLFLEKNQISDISSLVAMCKKDFEGEKNFAPFLWVYLAGNRLSEAAKKNQITELKNYGVRMTLEEK